jgi:single-stranded DNA-binding protein
MNNVHISATLTKEPEHNGKSCVLRLSYCKTSGKKCYITAVANGKKATELSRLSKGDEVWIDGHLASFESDKWKTYIQVTDAYTAKK